MTFYVQFLWLFFALVLILSIKRHCTMFICIWCFPEHTLSNNFDAENLHLCICLIISVKIFLWFFFHFSHSPSHLIYRISSLSLCSLITHSKLNANLRGTGWKFLKEKHTISLIWIFKQVFLMFFLKVFFVSGFSYSIIQAKALFNQKHPLLPSKPTSINIQHKTTTTT